VEKYVAKFQKLSVMVLDIPKGRLIVLFIEGLSKPLEGLVKDLNASSLQETIMKALDLETSIPMYKSYSKNPSFDQSTKVS